MNSAQRNALLNRGYLLGAQIGKGTFGTVFQCTALRTHVTYAVKAMDLRTLRMRSEFEESRLLREIEVMKRLSHPFIVHLHEVIQEQDALFLIMELVVGIDLFDTIVANQGLEEQTARFIFYQLCAALAHMHAQGILHRDVKPENILIRGPSSSSSLSTNYNKPWIKLVDFGLSKVQVGGDLNSFVGTPRYIAPEVLNVGEEEKRRRNGNNENEVSHMPKPTYSTPADCFSAGICLFVMLANCFPKFEDGIIQFTNGKSTSISNDAKDLILKLTAPDPSARFSMKQALLHPWLLPAKELVEELIKSESNLVVHSKSHNNSRPNKRPFMDNATFQFPSSSTSWSTHHAAPNSFFQNTNASMPAFPSSSSTQLGIWLNTSNFLQQFADPQIDPSPANASSSQQQPQHQSSPYFHPVTLSREVELEFWAAREASPTLCASNEVRSQIRATKNLLTQSDRVILKCVQTGISALELIPDIRDCLRQDRTLLETFEFVKLSLNLLKDFVNSMRNDVSETLVLNHQVLLNLGFAIQQLGYHPDSIAETISKMSIAATNPASSYVPSVSTVGKNKEIKLSPGAEKKEDAMTDAGLGKMEVDKMLPQPMDLGLSDLNKPLDLDLSNPNKPSMCISHLERVEQLLRFTESFWGRMDTALLVLQQRANMIEGLMARLAQNTDVIDRFIQRLEDYFGLWQSAATLCQQFQQSQTAVGQTSTFAVLNEGSPSSSLE